MADIELVIKIPKEDYKAIKNMQAIGDLTIPYVFDAIRNGTLLPKGHGDLIDRQELLKSTLCKTFRLRSVDIDDAPTIIEADVESEG